VRLLSNKIHLRGDVIWNWNGEHRHFCDICAFNVDIEVLSIVLNRKLLVLIINKMLPFQL